MFQIVKADAARQQVFGFANVAVKADGQPMVDLHGDEIPADVLEGAAYDFVMRFRECGEMHVGKGKGDVGTLIESVMITPEKLAAWGLPSDAVQPRWWVGFQLTAGQFAKVASGQYRMFSIQGRAVVDEVSE